MSQTSFTLQDYETALLSLADENGIYRVCPGTSPSVRPRPAAHQAGESDQAVACNWADWDLNSGWARCSSRW